MFNSKEYEWASITVVMGGRNVTGIRGVKYNTKQEKEVLYAKGNKAHAIQRGNKSCEGSITLLQSELDALTRAAGGDLLDANLNLIVAYGNPSQGEPISTDIIKGVEFTDVPKGMSQGDKFSEHELPFIALDVDYNAV